MKRRCAYTARESLSVISRYRNNYPPLAACSKHEKRQVRSVCKRPPLSAIALSSVLRFLQCCCLLERSEKSPAAIVLNCCRFLSCAAFPLLLINATSAPGHPHDVLSLFARCGTPPHSTTLCGLPVHGCGCVSRTALSLSHCNAEISSDDDERAAHKLQIGSKPLPIVSAHISQTFFFARSSHLILLFRIRRQPVLL